MADKPIDPTFDASHPMPDARHEMFCQNIVDGMSQIAAWEAAGYAAHASNASTFAKRPEIRARIDWLIRRKAAQAGLAFGTKIVVDLERVTGDAPPMTPEWFLYKIQQIVEDEGDNAPKTSEKLKALELGAKWLGYFDKASTPLETKDPQNDGATGIEDRTRRTIPNSKSALSRYSALVEGFGSEGSGSDAVRVDGPDHAAGAGEAPQDFGE